MEKPHSASNLPKIDLDPTTSLSRTSSPPPGRPSRAEMLATAVGGVLAHGKAVEAAKEFLDEKENDRKRQLSGSDIDEVDSVKRARDNCC